MVSGSWSLGMGPWNGIALRYNKVNGIMVTSYLGSTWRFQEDS